MGFCVSFGPMVTRRLPVRNDAAGRFSSDRRNAIERRQTSSDLAMSHGRDGAGSDGLDRPALPIGGP